MVSGGAPHGSRKERASRSFGSKRGPLNMLGGALQLLTVAALEVDRLPLAAPRRAPPILPALKGSIGEGPNRSNHSNHSNSFKIHEFSLEISKISENFNINFF